MNAIWNSIDVSGWTFGLHTRPESLFESVKNSVGRAIAESLPGWTPHRHAKGSIMDDDTGREARKMQLEKTSPHEGFISAVRTVMDPLSNPHCRCFCLARLTTSSSTTKPGMRICRLHPSINAAITRNPAKMKTQSDMEASQYKIDVVSRPLLLGINTSSLRIFKSSRH